MIPYIRMKVPLAGPHQGVPVTSEGGQDIFIPPNQDGQQSSVLPNLTPPTQGQGVSPPPTGPPPTPRERPGILRFLPYLLSILFVGVIIFLAIRFVPALFNRSLPGGPAQLTYWGLWEEESVMKTIIEDFQKEYPDITITYQKQNAKQYREILNNKLVSGEGPDIFRFHNTWVPMFRDYLVTLPSNVYTKEEFEKTFYPVAARDLRFGDSFIGIPLEIDTLALFINEDILQAAGLTPPKKWGELLKISREVRVFDSQRKIVTAGIALGAFDNVDHASDIIAFMMLQNRVDFKDLSKKSQTGKNLAEEALAYYVDEFGKGGELVWNDTLDPSTLAFAKGKVAMIFGYSWRIFEIRAINPSLRFKIIPPPSLFDNEPLTYASYWVEGVSKNSRHQKEAFMFLKYLSEKETMQKHYAEQAKLRSFGEPYSRVDLADSVKSNPDVWPFLELAPNAVSWYSASNTYDNGINDKLSKYFGEAVRSMTKQNISAASALDTLGRGINEVATTYGF